MFVFVQYITACSIVFFDVPFDLFNIRRSPRTVKIVKCYELCLHVRAGTHLKGRAYKHTDLSATHLCEKLFLLGVGVCCVNERNFLFRYTTLDKLVSDVVIHIECPVAFRCG